MPELDGLEATSKILSQDNSKTRIIILTTFDPDEYVYKALRAGASGFMLRRRSLSRQCEPLRRVAPCWRRILPGA